MEATRGIALLLSDAFVDRFVRLQQEASQVLDLSPKLSASGNLPHITMIQGTFRSEKPLTAAVPSTTSKSGEQTNLTVQLDGFEYQPTNWIFLKVNPSGRLREMHGEIANQVCGEMVVPEQIDPKKLAAYTPLERENALRYGYRYMFDAFNPHITLGKFQGDPPVNFLEHLNDLLTKFGIERSQTVAAASVYEMGAHGAHAATLHRNALV